MRRWLPHATVVASCGKGGRRGAIRRAGLEWWLPASPGPHARAAAPSAGRAASASPTSMCGASTRAAQRTCTAGGGGRRRHAPSDAPHASLPRRAKERVDFLPFGVWGRAAGRVPPASAARAE
eukprot:scaffold5182_cov376-Prasinococcus_capsulatus_cf.AAC.8